MRLQEIAVDQLLRFTGTRALAGAIKEAGQDIEAMGEHEVAEGLVRGGRVRSGRRAQRGIVRSQRCVGGESCGRTGDGRGRAVQSRERAAVTGVAKLPPGPKSWAQVKRPRPWARCWKSAPRKYAPHRRSRSRRLHLI